MTSPADLPDVGERVVVTERRQRGFVHGLLTQWQVRWPRMQICSSNFGQGGATSADVLNSVRRTALRREWDLALLEVGVNDVWGRFQGRPEAVAIDDFERNYQHALAALAAHARQVVAIEVPPIGWLGGIDAAAVNTELAAYNARARRAAAAAGAVFVALWEPFICTAREFGWVPQALGPQPESCSLWLADGVHLSNLGDALVGVEVDRALGADVGWSVFTPRT
ncbi:SGNH/GDSL hydrolase family protein [Nocardia altamirensis]|uniref:SGNH/GDSL hydrolase family protein n=1 Tax=Nocardia altamirensis TaxID=472158 RepID=UPI0014355572|nr:GDSL-type esterase/lipase family protein [Nocardia altamirensis]